MQFPHIHEDAGVPGNESISDSEADAEAESPVCPACGYDLRAITSDKCPECGLAVDRELLSVSRIPWEHRSQIGPLAAFWRTIGLVLFRLADFATEVNRPVDHASARRFKLLCVTIGSGAQCGWTVGPLLYDDVPHFRGGWSTQWVMIGAICLAIWVYNYLASTVPSFWFRFDGLAEEKQKRAPALSYYASAPLVVLPAPALMFLVYAVLDGMNAIPNPLQPLIPLVAVIVIFVTYVYGYLLTLRLMRLMTGADAGRVFTMALALPAQWVVCGILAVMIPLASYYLWIAVTSLY